jgi:hypothetical protein
MTLPAIQTAHGAVDTIAEASRGFLRGRDNFAELILARLSQPGDCEQASRALNKHRQMIRARVEKEFFRHFTVPLSDEAKAIFYEDWIEALEPYTPAEVKAAFGKWNRENRGKPSEQDIAEIARLSRRMSVEDEERAAAFKAQNERRPEPEPERVTAEAAAEIMRAAGFRVNKFGGDA